MVKKLFGTRSITHLIYGLLLLLPFGMILGRVCYTVVNKNAKDSYSHSYVDKIIKINSSSNMVGGVDYLLSINDRDDVATTGKIGYSYISINWSDYIPNANQSNYHAFQSYNTYVMLFYLDGNGTEQITYGTNNKPLTLIPNFTFTANMTYTSNQSFNGNVNITQYLIVEEKLDNAFEYSLNEFTKDNANLNSINFFGWFQGLFLNQSNTHNLLYLNFANWYMNYALLISAAYLLFMALLWFINYVRRILDKSMNHDFGGF